MIWDDLIDAIGPASILVVIASRMGPRLRGELAPEDVWQEALLEVWRSRQQFEWRGLAAFRRWVLAVAENCMRRAVSRMDTLKRGGGQPAIRFADLLASADSQGSEAFPAGVASTTPSRIAMYREQAVMMRTALEDLPDELREVVRMRLFDQLTVEETARQLSVGPSAVRHRFRKGAELYWRRLSAEITAHSAAAGEQGANPP